MNKERARLVVEHVVVNRGDLDAVVLQGLDERIDLARERHEVTGNGRLAVARRLKVDGDCRAHRAGNRHAVLLDAVRPRHAELIDAVVGAALESYGLIDVVRWNAEIGRSGSRSRAHLPWGLALLQRDACHSRQLFRTALPGYVHIEG
jgi:hypothetical protein